MAVGTMSSADEHKTGHAVGCAIGGQGWNGVETQVD